MSETADIGKQQVAAVYAKALIGASENAGNTAAVAEELNSLVEDVFNNFPDFESTLGSSRLGVEEKTGMIDRVLGSGSEQVRTFLKVLANHDRLDCVRQVNDRFKKLVNELAQRVEVEITTAQPLSDKQRGEVVDGLKSKINREIDLTQKIDEDIIGGMIVRVGDTVVDGSVRNKLSQMKSQAVQKVVEQIHGASDRFTSS